MKTTLIKDKLSFCPENELESFELGEIVGACGSLMQIEITTRKESDTLKTKNEYVEKVDLTIPHLIKFLSSQYLRNIR